MILSLFACAAFEDIFDIETVDVGDHLDGLTDPFVMQSWYLGIAPIAPELQIEGTDWSRGAIGLTFVGNASDLSNLEDAPLSGAEVSLRSEEMGDVPMDEIDAGTYKATGEDGLYYGVGQDVTLRVDDGELVHSVKVPAPRAPDISIPEELDRAEPLVIDIEGQGYDGLLAVVIDVQTQTVLFDNTPQTGTEILAFLNGDRPQRIEVPGSVFDRDSVFAIGIGGLSSPVTEDYVEFNTALSRVIAGQIEFHAATTVDIP